MLEDSRFDAGERLQRALFCFATHIETAPIPPKTSSETREILLLRRQVQERLRQDDWILKQSGRYSPADLAGMDYVLYSLTLNRFFFIDVTTDVVLKWQLPRLRKMYVFRIELDETDAISNATKRLFLEKLLELIEAPVLFPLAECGYPSLDGSLAARDAAADLEGFRARLQTRMRVLRQLATAHPEHAETAELVQEYWLDLARLCKFAKEEDTRQTDPLHLQQQKVFEAWAGRAAENAVRATIAPPGTFSFAKHVGTHEATFEERRDQIVLHVQGRRFRLGGITTLITQAGVNVWAKKRMNPGLWSQKTYTNSGMGQKQSAENLVRLIETTPLPTLLGATFPLPEPVAKAKPGSKRFRVASNRRF